MKQAAQSDAECNGRNEVEAENRGRAKPTETLSRVERRPVRAMCVDIRSLRGAH